MKPLLEYLVTAIVPHPEAVEIEETEQGDFLNLNLKVHPDDVKIVIGKEGRTIKALRELLRLKAISQKKRVNLQIAS